MKNYSGSLAKLACETGCATNSFQTSTFGVGFWRARHRQTLALQDGRVGQCLVGKSGRKNGDLRLGGAHGTANKSAGGLHPKEHRNVPCFVYVAKGEDIMRADRVESKIAHLLLAGLILLVTSILGCLVLST